MSAGVGFILHVCSCQLIMTSRWCLNVGPGICSEGKSSNIYSEQPPGPWLFSYNRTSKSVLFLLHQFDFTNRDNLITIKEPCCAFLSVSSYSKHCGTSTYVTAPIYIHLSWPMRYGLIVRCVYVTSNVITNLDIANVLAVRAASVRSRAVRLKFQLPIFVGFKMKSHIRI